MKCQNCGHEYPSTLTRCTRCKQINPTKAQKSQSKLLEFPPRPRAIQEKEPPQAKVPAWRAEVSERVRAAKARRSGSSLDDSVETSLSTPYVADENEKPALPARPPEPQIATQVTATGSAGAATGIARPTSIPVEPVDQPSVSTASISKPTSNLVEAALTRVRRASENANRAMLPRIGPSPQQSAAKPAIAHDKEATARAIEIEEQPKPVVAVSPEPISVPASRQRAETTDPRPVTLKAQPVIDPQEAFSFSALEIETESVLTEIEPRDYLAEEVRKVSRADLDFEGAVPLATHLIINLTDMLVLTFSCAPFLASMMLAGADTISSQTVSATALVALVVSFFYCAVTQALCGKTFGMMITNTRVVSMETGEPLSIQQSLIRTVGYFIALLPVMAGFIWIAFNPARRGLHDLISGSIVIRDDEGF